MMLALSVSSIGDRQGHGGCLGVGVTLSMCGVSPSYVRRLADFVRRLADFQNHAGPRLTLLRLRGGVQGRRPRLRL